MSAAFHIPLNLPHAATVAIRICSRIQEEGGDAEASTACRLSAELVKYLYPYKLDGENPPGVAAELAAAESLSLARALVEAIREDRLGSDRLGQSVRNLFECLERGTEGAEVGLLLGEDPKSLQRPY